MPDETTKKEFVSIFFTVDVPHRFAAGRYMSRFLIELWDNCRFSGIRCLRCGSTRPSIPSCFVRCRDHSIIFSDPPRHALLGENPHYGRPIYLPFGPEILLRARLFDRNRANLGQIE
jgi:hypothetical protein